MRFSGASGNHQVPTYILFSTVKSYHIVVTHSLIEATGRVHADKRTSVKL